MAETNADGPKPGAGRSRLVLVVLALPVLNAAYVSLTVLASPGELRVQFLPDDSYYYLTLARNFATSGRWTFDSGVSLTSGYHPLHAYVLAATYALFKPGTEGFVTCALLISIVLAAIAMGGAVAACARSGKIAAALLLALFLMSRSTLANMVSGIEWGWVVVLAMLYALAFARAGSRPLRLAVLTMLGLGFLGSLARSDFGLWPATIALGSLLSVRRPDGGRRLVEAVAGVSGAGCGVAAVLLHSQLTSGQWLQSSAQMKALWESITGPTPYGIATYYLYLFGAADRPTLLLTAALVACTLFLGWRWLLACWRGRPLDDDPIAGQDPRLAALWIGSLLSVAGFTCLYVFNPVVQMWYTANIMVPCFLVFYLPFRFTAPRHPACLAAGALLLLLIAKQTPLTARHLQQPTWPFQVLKYDAGVYLAEQPVDGPVASWNAGIIGYYQGGQVINLDGLVNNDIYDYARRTAITEYLASRGVRWLVDSGPIVRHEKVVRGGYDPATFVDHIEVFKVFERPEVTPRKLYIWRYSAKPSGSPG